MKDKTLSMVAQEYISGEQYQTAIRRELQRMVDAEPDSKKRRSMYSKYKLKFKPDAGREYLTEDDISDVLILIMDGCSRENAIDIYCDQYDLDKDHFIAIAKNTHSSDVIYRAVKEAVRTGVDVLTKQHHTLSGFKYERVPYKTFGRVDSISEQYYIIYAVCEDNTRLLHDVEMLKCEVADLKLRLDKQNIPQPSIEDLIQTRLGLGWSKVDIARELGINERTVRRYAKKIKSELE